MSKKSILLVLIVLVVVLTSTAVVEAGAVRLSGRVEVEYNKGNGLNQYYLITPNGKFRVWAHILDPHQDAKEEALRKAADENLTVEITGDMEDTIKETTIKIKEIKFE